MNNSDDITSLLRESIAASNRTTRAVRAFVRFLFIQLSFTTFAGALIYFGTSNVNVVQCATSGENCEPNVGLIVFGLLIWIVGVVWSSNAGWSELGMSDPDKFENRALSAKEVEELQRQEKDRLDAFNKGEANRLLAEEKQRAIDEAAAEKARAQAVEEDQKRRDAQRAWRQEMYKKTWVRVTGVAVALGIIASVVFAQNIADAFRSEAERASLAQEAERQADLENSVQPIMSAIDGCGTPSVEPMVGQGLVKIDIHDSSFAACVVNDLTGSDLSTLGLFPGSSPKNINGYELKILGSWLTITAS